MQHLKIYLELKSKQTHILEIMSCHSSVCKLSAYGLRNATLTVQYCTPSYVYNLNFSVLDM